MKRKKISHKKTMASVREGHSRIRSKLRKARQCREVAEVGGAGGRDVRQIKNGRVGLQLEKAFAPAK